MACLHSASKKSNDIRAGTDGLSGHSRCHKGRHIHLAGAGAEESDDLFIRRKAIPEVYEVFSQQVVTATHQIDEYMQEMNTVKNYCIVGHIFIESFQEISRMLCPVHGGLQVVADVVTIVPAFYIVLGIDAGNAVLIGIARIIGSNKGMLRPVARHGYDAEGKERQYEHNQCSRPVDKAQPYAHGYEQ